MQNEEITGTSECPICGIDTPHHHTDKEVDMYHDYQQLKHELNSLRPPSPHDDAGAVAQQIAAEVLRAVRTLRQDVRPYMRHMEDCELVKHRMRADISHGRVPKCDCGLEKVLWDLPAKNETGRTK